MVQKMPLTTPTNWNRTVSDMFDSCLGLNMEDGDITSCDTGSLDLTSPPQSTQSTQSSDGLENLGSWPFSLADVLQSNMAFSSDELCNVFFPSLSTRSTNEEVPPSPNPNIRHHCHFRKHYRTQLCPFLFGENQHCIKGNKCGYAHSNEDLRSRPDLRKTKLCSAYMKGQCTDPNCKYAHGRHELRSTNEYYKTSPCKYWACGICYAGDNCRHAHGEGEIRGWQPTPFYYPSHSTRSWGF